MRRSAQFVFGRRRICFCVAPNQPLREGHEPLVVASRRAVPTLMPESSHFDSMEPALESRRVPSGSLACSSEVLRLSSRLLARGFSDRVTPPALLLEGRMHDEW